LHAVQPRKQQLFAQQRLLLEGWGLDQLVLSDGAQGGALDGGLERGQGLVGLEGGADVAEG